MKCASRACVAAAVLATLSSLASASVHVVAPANPPSGTTFIDTFYRSRSGPRPYSLSRNGRYVAFTSYAGDLVPGVAPGFRKSAVFLRDRVAGTTVLVSHGASPTDTGNSASRLPRVSEGGEVVVFESSALGYDSLAYVFDRATNSVEAFPGLLDVGTTADGSNLVAWLTDGTEANVVLVERSTGARRLISHRAGSPTESASPSWSPVVTPDGRYIAFLSTSPNLVTGLGELPGAYQVFLYDTVTATTLLVSRAAMGGYANANAGAPLRISRDGRFVAYPSRATNLVPGQIDREGTTDLFLFDRLSLETRLVTHTAASHSTSAEGFSHGSLEGFDMSGDGSVIALETTASSLAPGVLDTNQDYDIYLYERATGLLQLVSGQPDFPSLSWSRGGAFPSLSGDGRFVTFGTASYQTNHAEEDISIFDRSTNSRRGVLSTRPLGSPPNQGTSLPVLARDGTFLIFRSYASNLAADVPDFDYAFWPGGDGMTLYGAELPSCRLEAVSRSNRRAPVAYFPETGLLSLDGSTTLFDAYMGGVSSDPVEAGPGVSPDATTTYVSDRRSGRVEALALGAVGQVRDSWSLQTSADGMTVLFTSRKDLIGTRPSSACALATEYSGTFGCTSLYLFDRRTGRISLVSHTGDPSVRASGFRRGNPPLMSDDGAFVIFRTWAGELADRYGSGNLVLWDRSSGAHRPLPVGPDDFFASVFVSRSGGQLIWAGYSGLYLQDVESGKLTLVDGGIPTVSRDSVSRDGETVAYLTRPVSDWAARSLFVFSRSTGTYERIPTDSPAPMTPALSADGRFLVFGEGDSRLVLWDRLTSRRTMITAPDGLTPDPGQPFALSADGSTVAFSTIRERDPSQVVHWDRLRGRSVLASGGTNEARGNGPSIVRGLDEHGDRLLMYSTASNLRPEDGTVAPEAFAGSLYVFDAPPIVTGAEPPCASASGGERVEIRGAHFQKGAKVRLAGVAATVVSVSSTSIIVIAGPVPPGKGPLSGVEVENPDGAVDRAGGFSYPIRGAGCATQETR